MDEESRAKRLYTSIEGDMEDLYIELESLYSCIDEMVRGGIVGWETYSRVNNYYGASDSFNFENLNKYICWRDWHQTLI